MGRRQAWPGQILGKSAIEHSKKNIIVKEFYFGEQPKQKLSQIMVTVQKEGGGCRVSAEIKIIYISNVD